VQTVVNLLQVGTICLQYSHDDIILISQIFRNLIHVSAVAYMFMNIEA